MSSFSDSKAISGYAENAIRRVPGLKDIHRMSALLMAERTPPIGRVLIVGAGGGMELSYFAQTFADWKFDGVDPSKEMLDLAKLIWVRWLHVCNYTAVILRQHPKGHSMQQLAF